MNLLKISQFGQMVRGHWQEEVLPRYQRLLPREQRLLIFTAIALPALLFVYGIWLPVTDRIHALRDAMPALQDQLREAQTLADRLQQGGHKLAGKRNTLALVEQAAKASGVRRYITRIKPQPGMGGGQRLLIRMHQVPYPKLVKFMNRLAKDGLALGRAKLLAGNKLGLLDADLLAEGG